MNGKIFHILDDTGVSRGLIWCSEKDFRGHETLDRVVNEVYQSGVPNVATVAAKELAKTFPGIQFEKVNDTEIYV